MKQAVHLSDVLGQFVQRAGYTPGQLARLTGVPKATIVNWLEGRVRRPRGSDDLVKLAGVLHLTEGEASDLLSAAGHQSIAEMVKRGRDKGDGQLLSLLSPWMQVDTPRPGRTPFQAIADLPHFVGRTTLLNTIQTALLSDENIILYSLQGMGGVGKTTLAAHLAYRLRTHFPDGVLWARVDTSDTMSTLSTFAHAYGYEVSQYTDLASRSRVVRELLANKHTLMVLDNVESSQQIEPLLPPSGRCTVLITTRQRNLSALRGGQAFQIGPFADDGQESLHLFRRVLGAQRVARERETLAQIAALLGHLPLAIDIVASRMAYEPGWSAHDFWQRLKRKKRRLHELAYEDQSVRFSFTASYTALSPEEQAVFVALGLFVGEDFLAEAVAFVTEMDLFDAEDVLRRLYGLSLVQQSRPGRYRLHPLLRDFARDQQPSPQQADRLITFYIGFAETHSYDFKTLDGESDNLLSAIPTAQGALLGRGVAALYPFLEARGLYDLADELLERALGGVPGRELTSQLLRQRGRIAERRGHYKQAETHYERGLEHAKTAANPALTSDLLRSLGVLSARQGDYVMAEAYYQEGMQHTHLVSQEDNISRLLRGLGVQAFMRGDYLRAEALYEEGLAIAQAKNERVRQSGLLWALGMLAEDQGDLVQAESYLQQSAALARELGHQERVTTLLRDLGVVAREKGDLTQARLYLQEAVLLARELGHDWRITHILLELGNLHLRQNKAGMAEAAFREVLVVARRAGSREMIASAVFGLAQVYWVRGEKEVAVNSGRESLRMFQTIGHFKANDAQDWLVEIRD